MKPFLGMGARRTEDAQSEGSGEQEPILAIDSALLRDVDVVLEVKIGEVTLSIGEIMALKAGSMIQLETALNEPVEVRMKGALVARGEIVAIDDRFGVRILETADR